MVGSVGTVLNYDVFLLMLNVFHIHYVVSSAAGYLVGLFFGYFFNRGWTFQSSSSQIFREFCLYVSVYLFSLFASLVFLHILVEFFHFSPFLANILVIIFSTITNYFGCRRFVF